VTKAAEGRAAAHLAFLQDLQRLLDEGQFVASYKFALLMAITELCLEREPAEDGTLRLHLRDLAARIIEVYWPQVAPFRGEAALHQNTGKPAAILRHVALAREGRGTLAEARRSRKWDALVGQVARHIEKMPLFKLQVVGGGPRTFLYEHRLDYGAVTLNPGVAQSFRALNPIVVALVQMAWIRYLHRVPANRAIIGADSDLATFLFGSERNVLKMLREPLRDLQAARCFYCRRKIPKGGDIDHFIPWARYPRDLGHNFVLAHAKCNASKSDFLADIPHLAAWSERNERDRNSLSEIFEGVKILHDEPTTLRVAGWAYESTAAAKGMVWRARESKPRPLGQGWREILT